MVTVNLVATLYITDQNIAPAASIPASIPPPVVLAVAPVLASHEEDKSGKDIEEVEDTESARSSSTASSSASPHRSHWKKYPVRHSKFRASMEGSSPLRSQEQLVKSEPQETTQELHRLDLKIEKMRKNEVSALPGHASDHRVANYHSVSSMYLRRSIPLTSFHELPQVSSTPSSRYSQSFQSHQPSTSPVQSHVPVQSSPAFDRNRTAVIPHLSSPSSTTGSLFGSSPGFQHQSQQQCAADMMSQELSRSMSQDKTSSAASSPSRVPSPSDIKESVLNLTRASTGQLQHQQPMYDSLSSPSTILSHQLQQQHASHRLPIQTAYHPRANHYSTALSRSLSPPGHHAMGSSYTQSSSMGHPYSGLFASPSRHTPTSIPVSVVTSLSDQLRKVNTVSSFLSNAGNHSSPEDDDRLMAAHLRNPSHLRSQTGLDHTGSVSFRNQTAGRKTIPSSIISTGTRTTSRHLSSDSPPLVMMSSQQHHHLRPSHHHALQQQQHHSNHHQDSLMDPIAGLSALSIPHAVQTASHAHESSHHGHSSGHHSQLPSVIPQSSRPAPLPSGNPSKPFKCPLCQKNLASKNVYQLHLRSHSGEKPFSCNLCGNAFSQKTSLTRHMRSHTGERPFPCSVCGKRFADKERIKIHMRTHTGEKPFACGICSKSFSQKSTVKRHMTVHTGEKPFKCSSCGKGFANRGNLIAHEKTHSAATALSVANAARHLALQQRVHHHHQQQQSLQEQMMLQQQMHLQHSMDQTLSGPPSPSSSQHAIMTASSSSVQQLQHHQ